MKFSLRQSSADSQQAETEIQKLPFEETKMKMRKELLSMLIILGFSAFLQACDDGPMENAGEAIDEAAEDVGDGLEDACEEISNENC